MTVPALATEYDKWVRREWRLRYELADDPENDALQWAHREATGRLEQARRKMKEATE